MGDDLSARRDAAHTEEIKTVNGAIMDAVTGYMRHRRPDLAGDHEGQRAFCVKFLRALATAHEET